MNSKLKFYVLEINQYSENMFFWSICKQYLDKHYLNGSFEVLAQILPLLLPSLLFDRRKWSLKKIKGLAQGHTSNGNQVSSMPFASFTAPHGPISGDRSGDSIESIKKIEGSHLSSLELGDKVTEKNWV